MAKVGSRQMCVVAGRVVAGHVVAGHVVVAGRVATGVATGLARSHREAVSRLRSLTLLPKLLRHTSPERLELLLEPEILVVLLLELGWSKEDIAAAVEREKKIPGDLLLELFEKHGGDVVWETLPPRVQSRAKEPPKAALLDDIPRSAAVGGVVALCGVTPAAMMVLGVIPELGQGLSMTAVMTALTGGLLGGVISIPWARTAGILGGLTCASTTLALAALIAPYFDEPGRLAVCIAVLPGALAGLIVSMSLAKRFEREDRPNTF